MFQIWFKLHKTRFGIRVQATGLEAAIRKARRLAPKGARWYFAE